jgi:hypothetical protein
VLSVPSVVKGSCPIRAVDAVAIRVLASYVSHQRPSYRR